MKTIKRVIGIAAGVLAVSTQAHAAITFIAGDGSALD